MMVNSWWLVICSCGWFIVLVCMNRVSYRHGIWDGAFNHFLPAVRKEMMFYDKFRAERIFEQEQSWDT